MARVGRRLQFLASTVTVAFSMCTLAFCLLVEVRTLTLKLPSSNTLFYVDT
jgi:hypothetical protein